MKKKKCPNCGKKLYVEAINEATLPGRKVYNFTCTNVIKCGVFGKMVLKDDQI